MEILNSRRMYLERVFAVALCLLAFGQQGECQQSTGWPSSPDELEYSLAECFQSIERRDWADRRTRTLVNDCRERVDQAKKKLAGTRFVDLLEATLAYRLQPLISVERSSYQTQEYHKVMTERTLARFTGQLLQMDVSLLDERASQANVEQLAELKREFEQKLAVEPASKELPRIAKNVLSDSISEQLEVPAKDFFSPVHVRQMTEEEVERVRTILDQTVARFAEIAEEDVVKVEQERNARQKAFMIGVEAREQLRRALQELDDAKNTEVAAKRYEEWEESRSQVFKGIGKDLEAAEKLESKATSFESVHARIMKEARAREIAKNKRKAEIMGNQPEPVKPIQPMKPVEPMQKPPGSAEIPRQSSNQIWILWVLNLGAVVVIAGAIYIRKLRRERDSGSRRT